MSVVKNLLIFLLLVSYSYNIGVDYYDDDDYIYKEETINETVSIERRVGNNENIDMIDEKTDTKYVSITSSDYINNSSESTTTIEHNTKVKPNQLVVLSKFTGPDNQSNETEKFSPTFIPKSELIKDYSYVYDEEKDLVLRQETVAYNESEQTVNDTPPVKLKENSVQFYNLEPAVESDILHSEFNETRNENVWYVPENYPCWELPLLYGELGQKRMTSKIFLIHGGYLKNVIDPGYNISGFKPPRSSYPKPGNHWCGVQPCYGDHTLCLFPHMTMSKLCEEGYNVQVPTILDQIALVNTINSMRNRVASGESERYQHLPKAANMKQITYDYDLEKVSEAWLRQCLPGPAPCSALDGHFVSHLECTKYADYCCIRSQQSAFKCAPKMECFISPIIGCIHEWFWSGGKHIQIADVHCGRTSIKNYNSVQLLWGKTIKVGCAYGERINGDVRVVCNFAPGAPFYLDTKLYCGIIAHTTKSMVRDPDVEHFLSSIGVFWSVVEGHERIVPKFNTTNNVLSNLDVMENFKTVWGVQSLNKIYKDGWVRRKQRGERLNGTKAMIARLVTKFTFVDVNQARCDTNESMYVAGEAGSMCVERGRRYKNLCYDYRDPTPGYRLVAVAAPIALFTLILYDLFSGVVRQSN